MYIFRDFEYYFEGGNWGWGGGKNLIVKQYEFVDSSAKDKKLGTLFLILELTIRKKLSTVRGAESVQYVRGAESVDIKKLEDKQKKTRNT